MLSVEPGGMDDVVHYLDTDGTLSGKKAAPEIAPQRLREIYCAMVRTRIIDQRLTALQRQGRIGFHVGSMGEECAIVTSAAALRDTDWIVPCYREIGALLWRGFPLQTFIDNMYGNADDVVKGRQMPNHYTGKAFHFASVSSPVGTQITQATGLGWAAKLRGDNVASAVFFGEGATSSNDFHAALNFAGVHKIPTLFLCRNNHWAISVPPEKQTASVNFAAKGAAYGVHAVRVDGNDVFAVYEVVQQAVARAANKKGPTLIELLTYRLDGHSTSDDPKAYRSEAELNEYKERDPITRMRKYLENQGDWSEVEEVRYREEVEFEFKQCIEAAEAKSKPALRSIFEDVYKEMPEHLEKQLSECEAGPRANLGH